MSMKGDAPHFPFNLLNMIAYLQPSFIRAGAIYHTFKVFLGLTDAKAELPIKQILMRFC